MILDYVIQYHYDDLLSILLEPDTLAYYKIEIDFLKLFESFPDVGDNVLCKPIQTLPSCNCDLIKAQKKILEGNSNNNFRLKENVNARFFGLPVCPELHRTVFPKNIDLGCFLKVTGTVVRVTQAKMLEYHRKYICVKCKYENFVEAQFEHRYILRPPTKCSNPAERCRSTTFNPLNLVSREHCKDYQEIKIQEQVNKLSIGTIPGSMWVILDNDLVDCCKPGDDVHICGIVRRRWRPISHNKQTEVDIVLQANYIQVCNSQRSKIVSAAPDVNDCFNEFWGLYESCPMKGRDHILASVCPQVYGLYLVKLALLLTVITGHDQSVETDFDEKKTNTVVRGQCHLLLVGDPGTGKSQLLRAGAELTPRSVFTTGAGSTKAGLTCSALREEGEWQLEAGALVLSDGGVCCVDELAQLREHDRTAIHEAMEQQTISIAKAGIVCKLHTRCAVIAACNPRGHYQPSEPLSVNVALGTPLLSRFDLIFILLDSRNREWDKLVSSYILFGDSSKSNKKQWPIEKLQTYIALIGPKPTKITNSANIILQKYYMMQRGSEYRDPSRTTVRMLDSLVRLSQAHCRLMYRTQILPMDAIVAVSLVDLSMQDCTLKDTSDALHSTFPRYPDYDYLITAKKLLTRLNLDDIWNNELLNYAKLLNVDHKSLESDLNKGIMHTFAKFDDLTDDTIPLTNIITSSYFNNNKVVNREIDKEEMVNERLVATLKKHATLNKDQNLVPSKIETKKRKKRQVKVDSAEIKKKLKSNKKKVKISISYSSDEEIDPKRLLNAVPSVNDIFTDMDIHFNEDSIDIQNNDPVNTEANENLSVIENSCLSNNKENSMDVPRNNSFKDKLEQFRYVENHDNVQKSNCNSALESTGLNNNTEDSISNTFVENRCSHNKENVTNISFRDKLQQFRFVENRENEDRTENNDHVESIVNVFRNNSKSSQISIFEDNSDCDLDF